MKIALLYDAPLSLKEGQLRIDRGYGVRVNALAPYFQQLFLCNPVAEFDIPQAQFTLSAPNIVVQGLPYYGRVTRSLHLLLKSGVTIWRASRSWDLLYVTLPSPLGMVGYVCARLRKIPVVLSVVGDLEAQYEQGRYHGISGFAARVAVRLFERMTQWMVDHAPTITQGDALYKKYKRNGNWVINIPWSPITMEMIRVRDDTCLGHCIRLLFVGALLERKGIFVLLESAKLLRTRIDNFVVTYVGTGPSADELAQRVEDADLSGHVVLKGGIYAESELLREFDAADVFVYPTYAEGFPRVIFEAMARGLPVISTRVSGIPGTLRAGRDALLVNPGSPNEVAEAILKVARDPTFRRNLIRRGREIAQVYTLEETTRKRVETILAACSPA